MLASNIKMCLCRARRWKSVRQLASTSRPDSCSVALVCPGLARFGSDKSAPPDAKRAHKERLLDCEV